MSESVPLLEHLNIINFQNHENSHIPLGKFTAIIGKSRSGKSSSVRALEFLFYGDWDKTYPKDEEKPTVVNLVVNHPIDGRVLISRYRKGSENRAKIVLMSNNNTEEFKAFGSIIPGIEKYLKVQPIKIGSKSINLNLSGQDDPIFMLTESKSDKAQWIGRLYGAHILNTMMRFMSKDKRAADADFKRTSGELKTVSKEMESYPDAKSVNGKLENMRAEISLLHSLVLLRDEYRYVQEEEESLSENSMLSEFDFEAFKRTLKNLRNAIRIKTEWTRLEEEELFVSTRMESVERQIDSAAALLYRDIFKGGRCPLCDSKNKKVSSGHASKRLMTLMSSGDTNGKK